MIEFLCLLGDSLTPFRLLWLNITHWKAYKQLNLFLTLLEVGHPRSWCQHGRVTVFFLVHCCCSVARSHPTLCDPMDCRTPGFPVLHHLPQFAQTHIRWVGDVTQPSRPLSSPSLPAFNLFQHQGLFQWFGPLHQVPRILELQLQHQSFQWIFRVDFL